MESVVPEAQGKAAALSAYLAQGGTPFHFSGRYKKGPMKGKNVDEATAEFERMWATAPDAIKNKYASRSLSTDLAPIEKAKYGSDAVSPAGIVRPPAPAGMVRTSTPTARPAVVKSPAVVAPPVAKPSVTPQPSGDLSKQAMGTPEQQAKVAAMMGNGGDFGTADNGDNAMKAAVAMQKNTASEVPFVGPPSPAMQNAADQKKVDDSVANYDWSKGDDGKNRAEDIKQFRNNVATQKEKSPTTQFIDRASDAITGTINNAGSAIARTVKSPFVNKSQTAIEDQLAQRNTDIGIANQADAQFEQTKLAKDNADRMRQEKGLPNPPAQVTAPTPAPATATPQASQDSVAGSTTPPAVGPPTPKRFKSDFGPTPEGQELIGMNSGKPVYAPIAEVYGSSAATGSVGAPAPIETIRANYEKQQSTPEMQAWGASALNKYKPNEVSSSQQISSVSPQPAATQVTPPSPPIESMQDWSKRVAPQGEQDIKDGIWSADKQDAFLRPNNLPVPNRSAMGNQGAKVTAPRPGNFALPMRR